MRTEDEANDETNSYTDCQPSFPLSSRPHNIHPPIMPPILTASC